MHPRWFCGTDRSPDRLCACLCSAGLQPGIFLGSYIPTRSERVASRSPGSTGTPACALFCGAGQTCPDPVGINRGRQPERAFLAPARLSHVGADFSPPALLQRLADPSGRRFRPGRKGSGRAAEGPACPELSRRACPERSRRARRRRAPPHAPYGIGLVAAAPAPAGAGIPRSRRLSCGGSPLASPMVLRDRPKSRPSLRLSM